jgi:hypothetical protein
VQAFIKAFAPHGGLVAGELIAGCNDIGVGGFALWKGALGGVHYLFAQLF